jgi:hypothetical protein
MSTTKPNYFVIGIKANAWRQPALVLAVLLSRVMASRRGDDILK